MERRVRQIWTVLHIICSVGWLGVILGAIALSVAAMNTDDLERAKSLYVAMELLASTFFLPGTLLLVLTGVVLGLGTKWGLVKWWWVTVKLVIGLVLFAAGAFNMRFAVYNAADKAGELRPLESSVDVSLFGMLGVMALLGVIAALVSVMKPWGRINWRRSATTAKPEPREVREPSK
jgi:pilus assembly protein TadC